MCREKRIFNEVNNHKNNNKMTKKQEVLVYLSKQINDKKALVEYVNKKGYKSSMDELLNDDRKQEIRTLLNAMDLILGE
jgi:ribosomal protein S8